VGEAQPIKASAKKAAEAERLAAEISKRKEQREQVDVAMSRLMDAQGALRTKASGYGTFTSHLDGFYEEIDKLAKGKSMMQATDMIVEGTNTIIRDAKAIIDGDIYIERLKEFVPAGENPVYPDILMALRTIQQASARFGPGLQKRKPKITAAIKEAGAIRTVLDIFIENEGHVATSEEIEGLSPEWFVYNDEEDEDYESDEPVPFDFERLDGLDVTEHLTAILATLDAEE
jgi:hypothetical protein